VGAAGELGAGKELPRSYPRPLSWQRLMKSEGGRDKILLCSLSYSFSRLFCCPASFLSFVLFLGTHYFLWDKPGRRAKGSSQRAATARTADGESR